jgi:hypothetical protein
LSCPNKKEDGCSGLEDEYRPLFHCAKRQDRKNQDTAQAKHEDPLQHSTLPNAPALQINRVSRIDNQV